MPDEEEEEEATTKIEKMKKFINKEEDQVGREACANDKAPW